MPNHSTPAELYRRDLAAGRIQPDPAQQDTINALDDVFRKLVAYWEKPAGMLESLLGNEKKRLKAITGLYLWGGVGRGKTYLMDMFFHSLPGNRKRRLHFHRFMQMVHRELYANRGIKNPLGHVARNIALRADVLCFDEFFVSEIGDAMILGNLLETLFEEGVVLIATSNIEPARLYERGLQRQKFLPAIALLEEYTHVMNVDGGTDYRLRTLENAGIYHTPLNEAAEKAMLSCFESLVGEMQRDTETRIEILGRQLQARYLAQGVGWFDFRELCDGPRSAADYIEISQLFHSILVSGVPVFHADIDDQARRFISMVDEFYDQNVKLILSAAAPLEGLYRGEELAFPFERTCSRLLEMQSHEYLGHEHHPGG